MDFASLQHSIFLQALGSAILNSLWQCFILWLLYETFLVAYKNASARLKNNFSTILLFISFAWFVTSFISKLIHYATDNAVTQSGSGFAASASHSVSPLQQLIIYAGSSLSYLSIAYIFLLFFLMAKLFTAYRYVYIISNKRLVAPPAELKTFALKVAQQLKIAKKITVWISHHIDVPATIGFIKPVILIPFASLNNLSGEQLEAIILHELSHIKRNDYITNIVLSVIETILFFNPFVAMLSNAIKKERENCCDDFVLQYRYDPHSYASALFRLEQSRVNTIKLAVGAVSGKKQLLSRIKRITAGQVVVKQFNYGQKLLALVLITSIICSVAWLSPGEKKLVINKKMIVKENVSKEQDTNVKTKKIQKTLPQKEDVTAKILKEILIKKIPDAITNNKKKNFAEIENDNSVDNSTTFFGNNFKEFIPSVLNLKQSKFFFDKDKFKLPATVNIQNFSFQNMNFNIDLPKIDIEKLNENLQQAYKEIDAVNWNKVQSDIQKSFAHAHFDKSLYKKEVGFYLQQLKNLSAKKGIQQQENFFLRENINKENKIRDSVNATEIIMLNKNIKKAENQCASATAAVKTYTNYQIKPEKNDTKEPALYVEGNKILLTPHSSKNIVISLNSKQKTHLKREKKFMQFSVVDDAPSSKPSDVINISVTDLP